MMNNWLRRLRSFGGPVGRKLTATAYTVAFGALAALVSPANLSAAPSTFGLAEQTKSTAPNTMRGDLLLAHCCHSHPYAPFDNYCCHEPRYYAPGAAIVGGAVAYGTYRGVKSARKHYKKHHQNRPKPRRRR
jgi:hypothetical protein